MDDQTDEEWEQQQRMRGFFISGHLGYLHEYHVGPLCPSAHLVTEAFKAPAHIPVTVLRERLPQTLKVAEIHHRSFNGVVDDAAIEAFLKSYVDFVDFCEKIETRTGRPPLIIPKF